MRRYRTTFRHMPRLALACAAGALAFGLAAGSAEAGGRLKERVYDDSFGNLIIVSPSGYKRIVVGMGHLAAELHEQEAPKVVYGSGERPLELVRRCHRPAVLWKGRSYMYGLADGELPMPPLVCD